MLYMSIACGVRRGSAGSYGVRSPKTCGASMRSLPSQINTPNASSAAQHCYAMVFTLTSSDIVLITGAAGGLGLQLTRAFCAAGVGGVVLLDMNEPGLQHLATEVRHTWPSCSVWVVAVDLCDSVALQGAAVDIDQRVAPLYVSVVVNNAGIVSGSAFLDLDEDMTRKVFQVNVLAPMQLARHFLPGMLEAGRGRIVGVASVMGITSAAQLTAYCATKHAHVGFMGSLRMELAAMQARGVSALTVLPYILEYVLMRSRAL